jgi:hypothetical protein
LLITYVLFIAWLVFDQKSPFACNKPVGILADQMPNINKPDAKLKPKERKRRRLRSC